MNYRIVIIVAVLIGFAVFSQLDIYSLTGIGMLTFFVLKIFDEIGTKIEIRDVIIAFAVVQWIIGPMLAYKTMENDRIYYMAVPQDVYMAYVVIGVVAYVAGLYFPLFYKNYPADIFVNTAKEKFPQYKNLDIALIVIGFIAKLVEDFAPMSLRFFIYLIGNLRFVGLFLLFTSNRKNKYLYFGIVYFTLFLFALSYAMFFDFILWTIFIGFYVAIVIKPSFQTKLIATAAAIFVVFTIQTVKYYYRQAIATSGDKSRISIFIDLVSQKVFSDYAQSDINVQSTVTRINQGWIIARIMYWMPTYEPFAEGETISTALNAALVPRFLNPDKVQAGGRVYFKRFTGKDISENTSMGLSLIGEAYANYGKQGGWAFMFVIGLFFNFLIFVINRYSFKHPILLFFLPIVFLHAVKAETDFSVVLNYVVKASIFTVMFFIIVRNFFRINI